MVEPSVQGMVFFSLDRTCNLLGISRVRQCDSPNGWRPYFGEDFVPHFTSMVDVCDFLELSYKEFVQNSSLAEIRTRYGECPDCNRTFEEHMKPFRYDYDYNRLPWSHEISGWKHEVETIRSGLWFVQREQEEERKWKESGEKKAAAEEEAKQKNFTWPDIDPNTFDEMKFRLLNPNITFPRTFSHGRDMGLEWWDPPKEEPDSDAVPERFSRDGNPEGFMGTQLYDVLAVENGSFYKEMAGRMETQEQFYKRVEEAPKKAARNRGRNPVWSRMPWGEYVPVEEEQAFKRALKSNASLFQRPPPKLGLKMRRRRASLKPHMEL